MDKNSCYEFSEKIDVGIVLEQTWMLDELKKHFPESRKMYCFVIDKDVLILEKNNKKYLFLQTNGASIIACRVEEMKKWGATKIYRVGTCGALQKNIKIGDIVLSTAAIRDEGTSYQYIGEGFPAIAFFEDVLKFNTKLIKHNFDTCLGITWTTDGRFVESNEKLKKFSELGVKNVDMETSAFLIVCWIKKVSGISLSVVTDNPINDINEDFKGKIYDPKNIQEMLFKYIYKLCSVIIDEK